jgi:hypothetical protein
MGYWLYEPEHIAFINWEIFGNWKSLMIVIYNNYHVKYALKNSKGKYLFMGYFLKAREEHQKDSPGNLSFTILWDWGERKKG